MPLILSPDVPLIEERPLYVPVVRPDNRRHSAERQSGAVDLKDCRSYP